MKEIKCFVMGHKVTGDDCGYAVCDRCGKHEYYDYNKFFRTLPSFFRYLSIVFKQLREKVYTRCLDCGKIDTFFGKDVGDHSDCMPF